MDLEQPSPAPSVTPGEDTTLWPASSWELVEPVLMPLQAPSSSQWTQGPQLQTQPLAQPLAQPPGSMCPSVGHGPLWIGDFEDLYPDHCGSYQTNSFPSRSGAPQYPLQVRAPQPT